MRLFRVVGLQHHSIAHNHSIIVQTKASITACCILSCLGLSPDSVHPASQGSEPIRKATSNPLLVIG